MRSTKELRRHYKGQDYIFEGVVRHSETLESMALYTCRYDNPLGQRWIRPLEMFEGEIEINGVRRGRFAKIPIALESCDTIGPADVSLIKDLASATLRRSLGSEFDEKLRQQTGLRLDLARIEGRAVGFKLGYRRDETTFYSWLGGVRPEFRGLGVARRLMEQQHNWARGQGYARIRTKTDQRYNDMLILNLQMGFQVIGLEPLGLGPDDDQPPGTVVKKIVLEKTL